MAFPLFLSLFQLLLITSPTLIPFAYANESHRKLSLSSSTLNFPKAQAERLIRQLNLFPELEINISPGHPGNLSGSRIVEKQFSLSCLGDSGATVEDLGHHAGYYKLQHSKDARMFYLFFESRKSKSDPVVIWLTGGPGCSSELALFYENGPFKIANNLSLIWNDYGWDKVSNIIFVDQPIGTGFSYSSDKSDIRHNEEEVSNDLYDFLQAFFEEHPQYAKNDFYITGESYAGHYIPAFASRIQRGNKGKEGTGINLKGIAIGNGLTNPEIQYQAYTQYALDNKLITQADANTLSPLVSQCQQAIKSCGPDGGTSCRQAYSICNGLFNSILEIAGNINYYDIRKQCISNLCYDFSNMEKFLNEKSVRDALGVGDIEFVSCSGDVYQALITDWMRNLEVGVPAFLEDGVKVLVYAGECDLICNWLGNSRWVHAIEWSGQKDFEAAPDVPFVVDSVEAGLHKGHGPLSFLKVHDAGHMVPMDQPKASLVMIEKWMQGTLPVTGIADKLSTQ
ncbi:serine carboxypeptidase-like [Coffea arabica]|uniref:Carboxypeptidase n=1 Tax=Coffea arabica TaxID=13443 RepID=A0A6P6U3A9_COFAR|nr:serine carboxypeptidase-like [Coffea arabica]